MDSNELQEYKALTAVLSAQYSFGDWSRRTVLAPKKLKWDSLTVNEKSLLPWFPQYLHDLERAIDVNSRFFQRVALTTAESWGAEPDPEAWYECNERDLGRVRSLMVQYIREWASITAPERDISMGQILSTAERLFPDVEDRQHHEVLVPGAGLGRLVVEFVRRGFRTQGNDVSYEMLVNSSFILNATPSQNCFVLCPFVHKGSNVCSRKQQLRAVAFPEFLPRDVAQLNEEYPTVPVGELMSMVAGSFVDMYGPPDLNKVYEQYTEDAKAVEFRKVNSGRFSIVATCFFLDTASNIIDYLKTIHNCLKDDGYWINFGPLLWHHEEDDDVVNSVVIDPETGKRTTVPTPSKGLELSREDLLELISVIGFEFVEHQSDIESTYGGDPEALGHWHYKCEFWVCKKRQ